MQATVNSKTALKLLREEHESVRYLIEQLTNEEMTLPDTIMYGLYWDQNLSFKDLLGHLICYEAYALECIEAWEKGEKHPILDRLETPTGARDIHYEGIESRLHYSLTEILEE